MALPRIRYILLASKNKKIGGSIFWRWNKNQREEIVSKEFILPISIDYQLAKMVGLGMLFDMGFQKDKCVYSVVELGEL